MKDKEEYDLSVVVECSTSEEQVEIVRRIVKGLYRESYEGLGAVVVFNVERGRKENGHVEFVGHGKRRWGV